MADWYADDTDMALEGRLPVTLEPAEIPLVYRIGETVYRGIPDGFGPVMKRTAVDSNITEYVFTGTSPEGITVTAELRVYHDFPVAEWVAYFSNGTAGRSPVVSDIRLTVKIAGGNPILYHSNGDEQTEAGYETYRDAIDRKITVEPTDGLPNRNAFPYMRICMDDWFVNLAIGWAGAWTALIGPDGEGVSVSVGQKRCHMALLPGETMRTPLLLLMAAGESDDHARNLWRKYYFAHILPKDNGKPLGPKQTMHIANPNYAEFAGETIESQMYALETNLANGLKPDIWWLDAGWYPCPYRWWASVGEWYADPERFPEGLAPLGKMCEENGIDFLLWFEPERVRPGTKIANEHPEWLLHAEGTDEFLFDYSNPEALAWMTDYISGRIGEYHVRIYRQDFNIKPLPFWENAETEDRIGAVENLHVQGYLAFWDALLDRHPGLLIDSCASGGRRNEIETMRRSVPLHYTDVGYGHHPIKQKQVRLMFEWLPYFRSPNASWDYPDGHYATGSERNYGRGYDSFSCHGALAPVRSNNLPLDVSAEMLAFEKVMASVWRRAAGIEMRGDYYPLTECRKDPHDWYAMQFDDPAEGDGFVQVIRNTLVENDEYTVYLKAVRTEATYHFENLETGDTMTLTGEDVARGIPLTFAPRSGAVWFYRVV